MSEIEYKSLILEISKKLDELNILGDMLCLCEGKIASGSEDDIQNTWSLFKKLEEQNNLGADRLEDIKELLKGVGEWSLNEKVEKFERKRQRYICLLQQIILVLDELDDVERLVAICRGKISEESEGDIQNVRSLFKELETQNNLGIHRLGILKEILRETENHELLKKVEEFEEQRKQEDELKRKEDDSKKRKAQALAVASSIGNKLRGVVNMKAVFKFAVVSTMEVLRRWRTFDQLVTAVNTRILPAGTSLVNIADGCVCLTVQAETLSALTTLWNLYQDGTLERRLYNFFVTDEVKERADGETIEVNVSIEEEEYDKARLELMNEAQETARIGDGERLRRNSDSAVLFRPKEETPVLKIINERIAVLERKFEQLHPEIPEDFSPEEKATKFSRQQESWKAHEAGEIEEGTDGVKISQRHKATLMDPGKLDLLQRYLEDVPDTRSIVTTNASDSGLATDTAASQLGTEEINESSKLCLKDVSDDIIVELSLRLHTDEAAMENFFQFFGFKMEYRYLFDGSFPFIREIKKIFPDTTVSVLKECFEVLQLYDLAELLEKARPRSLRPSVSPEQIDKLRGAGDRPTKYHSDVAALVVDFTVEDDFFEREDARKIKTCFKDLNSRNEVAIITNSRETRKVVSEMKKINHGLERYRIEDTLRKGLERILQQKARFEKELEKEMQSEKVRKKREGQSELEVQLTELKQQELMYRRQLENIAEPKTEQAERDTEKLEELKQEIAKPITTALNELVHKQEKFTCVVVFIRADYELCTEVLEGHVVEKLALIPHHTKLVVVPHAGWKSIAEVPETLHVVYRYDQRVPVLTRMIEIFKKRWQTLDLISMMQELKRTTLQPCDGYYVDPYTSIKVNSLSSLPKFQKKEDEHSS